MSTVTNKKIVFRDNSTPFALDTKSTISIPCSDLKPNELLVKVAFAALNPVDLLLHNTRKSFPLCKHAPAGTGRELSGTIVQVGANYKDSFKVDDRIVAMIKVTYSPNAPMSNYVKINSDSWLFTKIPDTVSLKDAGGFALSYMTGYTLLHEYVKIDKSSKILILGGGTVAGLYTLQLLQNHFGIHDVITVESSKTDALYAEKFPNLKISSVNYDKVDSVTDEISKIISDRFQGEKFDLILDCVGGNEFIGNISQYLKINKTNYKASGYLTIVGDKIFDYNGYILDTLRVVGNSIVRRVLHRIFNYGFTYELILLKFDLDNLNLGVKLLDEKKIVPLYDSIYPIENFKEAVEKLSTHHAKGKIVIELD